MENLKNWIKRSEGYSQFPYRCTSNYLTIGWGRNLDEVGISKEEAEIMLDNDIECCQHDLSIFPWYLEQPSGVQMALINMCFNIGIGRLLGFKKMIKALQKKDYTQASLESLDSKWAKQVPNRAKDIAIAIRAGI